MRVLITGAEGQVARALLESPPEEVAVTALSRRELDIADEEQVRRSVRRYAPDVIINAAAYTAVDRAESESATAMRVNSEGVRVLSLAALDGNARLLHLSTDFVFDGAASSPYRPESAARPQSVYGLSKRAGEEWVLQILPRNAVVVRTAWLYSAQGCNFVLTMLRLMAANRAVRVVADQVGSPTSARSVAQLLWKLVGRPDIHGIHHWTDAGVASWYDFAVAIAEEAAGLGILKSGVIVTPIATEDYPTAARRPAYSVLDRRSLPDLGIAPVHWRKNLRTVIEEIRGA